MKDAIDSLPADRPVEAEGFANRKLIRPSLNRTDHNHAQAPMGEHKERPERSERTRPPCRPWRGGRKTAPPEQTNAENFYYQKQMQAKTPMVIVLRRWRRNTWHDRVVRQELHQGQPNSQTNLLIYKPAIKYMYKEGENSKK